MIIIVSQITSKSTVCSRVCSHEEQRKHEWSTLLALCERTLGGFFLTIFKRYLFLHLSLYNLMDCIFRLDPVGRHIILSFPCFLYSGSGFRYIQPTVIYLWLICHLYLFPTSRWIFRVLSIHCYADCGFYSSLSIVSSEIPYWFNGIWLGHSPQVLWHAYVTKYNDSQRSLMQLPCHYIQQLLGLGYHYTVHCCLTMPNPHVPQTITNKLYGKQPILVRLTFWLAALTDVFT